MSILFKWSYERLNIAKRATKFRPNKTDRKAFDKMCGEGFIDDLLEQAYSTKKLATLPKAISLLKDVLTGPKMS